VVDWFEGRGHEAVGDFWAAYGRATVSGSDVPFDSLDALGARTGAWRAYEDYLGSLAADHANRGVDVNVWTEKVNAFTARMLPILVEDLALDRARLVAALAVLGELTTRLLAVISQQYVVRQRRIRIAVEARHARLFDASPDPVIGIDASGRVTAFSKAAEATFGYTAAAAIGASLAELVIPERFREQHARGLARIVAGEPSRVLGHRTEMIAMRADGSELPVELTIVATPDLEGQAGFTGFLRDLTSQRQGEESSALWSYALEQAAFGIVVSDRISRTITRANAAYAQMLGYQPAELVGMAGERLIAPSTLVQLPAVAATLRARRHHTYELNLLRKNGAIVPVLASSSPVETSSGAQLLVSTVIEISDRVQLEQERAAAMARLASVSEVGHELAGASSDLGALLDLVARRVAENIGDACAIRLVSADGASLEPRATFYHADPGLRALAREVLGSERQPVGVGIAGRVAATGKPILIPEIETEAALEIAAPPFRDMLRRIGVHSVLAIPVRSRGQVTGVLSMLRNKPGRPYTVDDQRHAQDLADRAGLAIENATLVATLEQRVRERTAELEATNDQLEAFSYSVSHDLRAPLRAIDGFSRALETDLRGQLGEESEHHLQRIRAGAQRMGRLIDDLLGLARIGRATIERRPVNLSAIASTILADLSKRSPERDVIVEIAPDLTAHSDRRLVKILLESLLGNAWKFTAKTANARISIGGKDDEFFVRDNGAGFDMAYVGRLFTPFQRLHTAGEFDGEGIGLATAHRIVSHHRGRIWAESEPGQGATFFFTLGKR